MTSGSWVFMGVPLPDPGSLLRPPKGLQASVTGVEGQINTSVHRGRFSFLTGGEVWIDFTKPFLIPIFTCKALFSVSSHLGMSRQL